MVGDLPPSTAPMKPRELGEVLLEARDVSLEDRGRTVLDRVSFTINRGEIVGVAGVDGNGQAELIDLIAGLREPSGGTISVRKPSSTAFGAGVAVIPQDRDRDGLILTMKLWENLILPAPLRDRFTIHGLLDRESIDARCAELVARFAVRASSGQAPVSSLSGGNRQRFEVGRALESRPAILVAHNVCRGLDLMAFAEIHRHLSRFVRSGGGLLLISSDLDELLSTSDRLAVIHGGRLIFTSPKQRSPAELGLLMAGKSVATDPAGT